MYLILLFILLILLALLLSYDIFLLCYKNNLIKYGGGPLLNNIFEHYRTNLQNYYTVDSINLVSVYLESLKDNEIFYEGTVITTISQITPTNSASTNATPTNSAATTKKLFELLMLQHVYNHEKNPSNIFLNINYELILQLPKNKNFVWVKNSCWMHSILQFFANIPLLYTFIQSIDNSDNDNFTNFDILSDIKKFLALNNSNLKYNSDIKYKSDELLKKISKRDNYFKNGLNPVVGYYGDLGNSNSFFILLVELITNYTIFSPFRYITKKRRDGHNISRGYNIIAKPNHIKDKKLCITRAIADYNPFYNPDYIGYDIFYPDLFCVNIESFKMPDRSQCIYKFTIDKIFSIGSIEYKLVGVLIKLNIHYICVIYNRNDHFWYVYDDMNYNNPKSLNDLLKY